MTPHSIYDPDPLMPPPLNDNGDRRGAEMIAGLCILAAVVITLCAWMGIL